MTKKRGAQPGNKNAEGKGKSAGGFADGLISGFRGNVFDVSRESSFLRNSKGQSRVTAGATTAGVLKGAAVGFHKGTHILPVIGTAIGTVGGAIGGGVKAYTVSRVGRKVGK